MAYQSSKLGRKQDEAILALMTHKNVEDAARAASVGVRTLWRWLKQPEFDAAYREVRRSTFSQSTARLQQASSAAVSTLLKIMVDPNAPAASRVRAADVVMEHGIRAIQIEDIQARLSELERATRESAIQN
jgi:hypothetical protein